MRLCRLLLPATVRDAPDTPLSMVPWGPGVRTWLVSPSHPRRTTGPWPQLAAWDASTAPWLRPGQWTPPFHISQLSRQLTKVSIRRSVRRDLLTIPKPSPRRLDAAAQQHSPDVPGAPSGDPRSRLQLAVPPVRLLRGQTGEPSLPRLLAHTPKTSRIRLT